MTTGLKGVVLAAGAGTRLRPLTLHTPKALACVGGRPLVEWALARIGPYAESVAVNAHHHATALAAHLHRISPTLHVSVEMPIPLGTAGALGKLRPWLDGADVLVTNADAWYLPDRIDPVMAHVVQTWDRERPRLLCVPTDAPADFGHLRYTGTALLPWWSVAGLAPAPSGLYEVLWAQLHRQGRLDLVVEPDLTAVDCGTAADLARADTLARRPDREPR